MTTTTKTSAVKGTRSKKSAASSPFLMFKSKPMVRCGNLIYYGNPGEKFIVKLEVQKSHTLKDIEVSDKVSVKLIHADSKKTIKAIEKNNLYDAIDIGSVWLERAL